MTPQTSESVARARAAQMAERAASGLTVNHDGRMTPARPAATLSLVTPTGELVTTDRTVAADLRASLAVRGVDAGTTFGDFIAACHAQGITERTPLASIEYGVSSMGTGRICVTFDADGVEIREGR